MFYCFYVVSYGEIYPKLHKELCSVYNGTSQGKQVPESPMQEKVSLHICVPVEVYGNVRQKKLNSTLLRVYDRDVNSFYHHVRAVLFNLAANIKSELMEHIKGKHFPLW